MTELNITLILAAISILGSAFAIFKAVKEPDFKNEKALGVLKEQLNTERAVTAETVKTMQNCLHTVEMKIDRQSEDLRAMSNQITRLATIVEYEKEHK